MLIGMDFGTTNTGAALYDGKRVRLLDLDPSSPTPVTCRSAVYITRGREYYLGEAALTTYFNQNVGRPSRFVKVRIGEIQQVFAELPTFYRDVYVYEDEYSPGRLFVSIKTALRNRNYFGTVYQDTWYSSSDLVAIFLMGMKQRAEEQLGATLDSVVLGRPVHFSRDPEEDLVAQSRLLQAAFKAGFETVYLEYEPVAAALAYEMTLKQKETILVFDFGGGTLDFTVIEVGGGKRQVFATGGIAIAGDVFDQRLFRLTIPKHLGENDVFVQRGKRYPIPAHIFDQLSTPHEILSLNTPQNLEMLQGIHQGAIHKEKTRALLQVVSSNYALLLFDVVERTKRRLTDRLYASLSFDAGDLSLHETVLRSRFEQAIWRDYEAIRGELEETLQRSGVTPQKIDRVIRTGGSSQIPLFVGMLEDMFGAEKVRGIDIFSSVTSGLAIRGHQIASGAAELPAFTAASAGSSEAISTGENGLREVDLESVRQRITLSDKSRRGEVGLAQAALVVTGEARIAVYPARLLPQESRGGRFSLVPGTEAIEGNAAYAPAGGQVLLATNLFKFFSLPVQAMLLAQQAGGNALNDLLPLEAGEAVTALAPWQPEPASGALILVTNLGQVRIFDAALFAAQLAKKPYFQSEHRYNGLPGVLLLFPEEKAEGDYRIIVGTNLGRISAGSSREIGVASRDLLKARSDEVVTAAIACPSGTPLCALDRRGDLLPVMADRLAVQGPPGARAQILRRNFSLAVLAEANREAPRLVDLLTSQAAVLRLQLPAWDELAAWTRARKVLRLRPNETVLTVL